MLLVSVQTLVVADFLFFVLFSFLLFLFWFLVFCFLLVSFCFVSFISVSPGHGAGEGGQEGRGGGRQCLPSSGRDTFEPLPGLRGS